MKKTILFSLTVLLNLSVFSQDPETLNAISTAVPFLNVTPNAGERGMAEIGVVATEYNYEAGLFQNPALLSRNKKVFEIKISYMPWMRNVIPGISISDIGIYYSINEKNTIASNLYFFYDKGISFLVPSLIRGKGYEYYGSLKYAHSFSKEFSLGAGIKYFVSDISPIDVFPDRTKVSSYAGDIGMDYRNKITISTQKELRYDIGFAINNIGPKITYAESVYKDFIPTNLKIGTMWTYENQLSEKKQINYTLAYQAEKMLVPSPPYYENDGMLGMSNNVSAIEGIFQSFYDAPFGYKEELHEIIHKFGGS